MARFGFCGPTYQSQSMYVDAERCVNLYPEIVESSGTTKVALYPIPGTEIFANLGSTAILGLFVCQPNGSTTDRVFAVVQNGATQSLVEVFADKTFTVRGQLNAPTSTTVTFAHNGTQLGVTTGGQVWVLDLSTNVVSGPVGSLTTVSMIDYSDGFGIALLSNSNKFQISALLDFTTWPGLSVGQVSEFPDNVISMVVNQRLIYFQGRKATVPYVNAGFLDVPFIPISGVFIEGGAASQFGRTKLDNSIFWWDASERGRGIARRANGYIPQRISTHSVESIVGSYSTISDAISWAEEFEGHPFFVTYFPSGASVDGFPRSGATWVYDVATGLWHERAYWNPVAGHYEAHHSRNHIYAWGKHLVGDRQSGIIYEMSLPVRSGEGWRFVDDSGSPIRRLRRAPHVNDEAEWMFHGQLQIDLQVGISPQPPLSGPSPASRVILLADPSGTAWDVICTDDGTLQATLDSLGNLAGAVALNDYSQGKTYQLSVALDGSGNFSGVVASEIAFDPTMPSDIVMGTTPGFLETRLFISNGQLQTNSPLTYAREPQIYLRWSNDHAQTWSNYYPLDCGKAGEYTKRAIKRRLGRARTRTYEITMSDPVPWRLVDAYLKATPGPSL